MESAKSIYIPVGQAARKNRSTMSIKRFIKKYRILLSISSISIILLLIYAALMARFIQIIQTLN